MRIVSAGAIHVMIWCNGSFPSSCKRQRYDQILPLAVLTNARRGAEKAQ